MDPAIVSRTSVNLGIGQPMLFEDSIYINLLKVSPKGNLVILRCVYFLGVKIFFIIIWAHRLWWRSILI